MSESNINENLETISPLNVSNDDNQIESLKKDFDVERDKFLRIIADYENKMKRVQIDAVNLINSKISNLLVDLVPLLDDLTKAYEVSSDDSKEGISLIIKNTKKILNRHGVEEIFPKEGDDFNSDQHQAITSKPSDLEEGKILEIIKTGYKIGEKVILPAMVVTSV
ncbi:nucleotide exchange factor GrpE [Alphaproteobacteria bacterium endosymbiont of Tiliacea citrago]|uniref:nucleotide exchange factor GrpE n=1 Tax=Alphaproteobacteria bacterium endosymbiont of Tiliacea citrago TaxID=3077944 RepID=UPI00313E5802